MKRQLVCGFLALACLATAARGAESWMFQPSYYSHDPVDHVRIGRQYVPGAVFTRPQGEYITSGWRYNHSTIQIKGQTFDNLNQWESWYQGGAKY